MLSSFRHLLVLPASLVASLLGVAQARAQVPPSLVGQWEVSQISFTASQTVPPDILERMDNPEVAELNREMISGTAHLVVAFRADGSYQFTTVRSGQPNYTEAGTYTVSGKTLLAKNTDASGSSSFDHQQLVQVGRRKLVIEFPVGAELPGVLEEIEYRRVQ
jgi:hypothetical protein